MGKIKYENLIYLTVDFDKERERINFPRLFNKKQRKILLEIVAFVERSQFFEAIELCGKINQNNQNTFACRIEEYLDGNIQTILRDYIR